MTPKRFFWLVTMASTLILNGSTLGQQRGLEEKTMPYGGKWWLSVSALEQRGYINGEFDCEIWELGNKSAPNSTAEDVQNFVNQFYEDPPHWPVPVSRVIKMFDSRHAGPSKRSGMSKGEVWSKPHGYWDGLWWKDAGYPNTLEQLGYVEGFLTCYQGEGHRRKGIFSKSPAVYVSLISDWYKRTRKEDANITDVLFKFRDQDQHANSESK